MSPTKPSDTALRASFGQPRNQSIAQPVINPGNFLARSANFALTGEKHRTTCKFLRTVSKKNFTRDSGVSTGVPMLNHVLQGFFSGDTLGSQVHQLLPAKD